MFASMPFINPMHSIKPLRGTIKHRINQDKLNWLIINERAHRDTACGYGSSPSGRCSGDQYISNVAIHLAAVSVYMIRINGTRAGQLPHK